MREAGSGTRDTLTDHLAAQHPPLRARIAMELGTSAAVRSAIAAGVGPGVLSRLAVRDDLVLGRLVAVEVAGPPLTRQLTAVWRPDLDPLPPEGARLLAVAQGRRGYASAARLPAALAVHGNSPRSSGRALQTPVAAGRTRKQRGPVRRDEEGGSAARLARLRAGGGGDEVGDDRRAVGGQDRLGVKLDAFDRAGAVATPIGIAVRAVTTSSAGSVASSMISEW